MNVERLQSHENKKHEDVPAEYFDAYSEGNLRYPQERIGVISLLGNAVLKDPSFDPFRFVRSEMNETQLANTRNAMDTTHRKRHVPVFSSEGVQRAVSPTDTIIVDDGKLQLLWKSFARGTLCSIAILARIPNAGNLIRPASISEDWSVILQNIAHILVDKTERARIVSIFSSFARTLRDPENNSFAEVIRETVATGTRAQARAHYVRLFDKMLEDCRARGCYADEVIKLRDLFVY